MGTLVMEKLIEDCPVLLTDIDTDEGKVVNMQLLPKKSLGYYLLNDKTVIVALKGNHIVFKQDNILILADYEKNDEIKKKLKPLLITKVKNSSGKELEATDMYEHIKSLDDVEDTILSQLSAAKEKEKKKVKDPKKPEKDPKVVKPKSHIEKGSNASDGESGSKEDSSDESSKSSSSDSSKDGTDDNSSDKEGEGSKKSDSKTSEEDSSGSGESGGEEVLSDEDEEFGQAAILSKKRMPLEKVSSDRLERMSNAGNKLVIDLNRSLGELERGPSHRLARMPMASSKTKGKEEKEKPEKSKKSNSGKK